MTILVHNRVKLNAIKTKRLRNKRMLSALVILTGCILLRMQEPLHPRRVFNFGPFGNPYPPEQYGRELRTLSKYHGNGECEWIAPEKLGDDPMNTTTLLVSYPGSGKRLAWRVLEALTGSVTGDDWNLSENGYDKVLTMKTSYPHPEGVWRWGDKMDQSILLVRNPRAAIPSYHTLRYEINYSKTWAESFAWKNFTYTKRPSVDSWVAWRDARFNRQIDLWGRLIDFWMKEGQRKGPNNTYYQDHHCANDAFMDTCVPKTVIQFEKLVSANAQVGAMETDKIAEVLENSPNHVNVIEEGGRPCIHEKVLLRKEFYNANRDGNGPDPDLKRFEYWQVDAMKDEVTRIRDDYKKQPWDTDPRAQSLVAIMEEYIDELQKEYDLELTEWNQKYGQEAVVVAEEVIAQAVAAEAAAAAAEAEEAAIAEAEAELAAEAAALEALEAEAAAAALEADAVEMALAAQEAAVVAQEAADAAAEVEAADAAAMAAQAS